MNQTNKKCIEVCISITLVITNNYLALMTAVNNLVHFRLLYAIIKQSILVVINFTSVLYEKHNKILKKNINII